MGIRMTQFVGLNKRAKKFLLRAEHKGKYATKEGCMFDEEEILLGQWLKNGKYFVEVIQCYPWSSGPMIFTCLRDEKDKLRFKWSEQEIEAEL